MSYATITFLFFIAFTGILYFTIPKKFQWVCLFAASLSFYVLTCGKRTIFLIGAGIVIYLAALKINRISNEFDIRKKGLDKAERKILKKKTDRHKKSVVAISVLIMLLMLFSTKYFNFFGGMINEAADFFAAKEPVPELNILMPLGISYYTLMGIGYVADVYRGVTDAEKNPMKLLLFLCYFPHIIEGPFDRYKALSDQFNQPHYFDYVRIKSGGLRFVWGVFKKVVIADRAGLIVNTIFENPSSYSGSILLLTIILYTLQIYAEFSGCMDMVCGASQIFDIKIAENFRRPFLSASISEFWRRWHITLGLWLKDYIFYPISLSGHFKKLNEFVRKHVKNGHFVTMLPSAYALFFVWFSNGLWHGASGKYIFYGLYYYLLMMLGQGMKPLSDKVLHRLHISRDSHRYHIFEVFRTCLAVCFGMLIFRAATLTQASEIFLSILSDFNLSELFNGSLLLPGIHLYDYFILALSSAIFFMVSLFQERGYELRYEISKQMLPIRWSLYMSMIFSIIIFGAYGGNFDDTTFIYGEF